MKTARYNEGPLRDNVANALHLQPETRRWRRVSSSIRAALTCISATLAFVPGTPVKAADTLWPVPLKALPPKLPAKAPPVQVYDWTGWYFGGHTGYGRGHAGIALFDPGLAVPGWNG